MGSQRIPRELARVHGRMIQRTSQMISLISQNYHSTWIRCVVHSISKAWLYRGTIIRGCIIWSMGPPGSKNASRGFYSRRLWGTFPTWIKEGRSRKKVSIKLRKHEWSKNRIKITRANSPRSQRLQTREVSKATNSPISWRYRRREECEEYRYYWRQRKKDIRGDDMIAWPKEKTNHIPLKRYQRRWNSPTIREKIQRQEVMARIRATSHLRRWHECLARRIHGWHNRKNTRRRVTNVVQSKLPTHTIRRWAINHPSFTYQNDRPISERVQNNSGHRSCIFPEDSKRCNRYMCDVTPKWQQVCTGILWASRKSKTGKGIQAIYKANILHFLSHQDTYRKQQWVRDHRKTTPGGWNGSRYHNHDKRQGHTPERKGVMLYKMRSILLAMNGRASG